MLIAFDSDDEGADDDADVSAAMAAAAVAAGAQAAVDSDKESEDESSDDEVDLTADGGAAAGGAEPASQPKAKPKGKSSSGSLGLLRIGDVEIGSSEDGLSLKVQPHHRAIKFAFDGGERVLLLKFESIGRFMVPAAPGGGEDDAAAAVPAPAAAAAADSKSGKAAKSEAAASETVLCFEVVRAPLFQAKNDDGKLAESADFTADAVASTRTRYHAEFESESQLQAARAALGRSQRLSALMLTPVPASTAPRKFDAQCYATNARAERPDLLVPLAESAEATVAKAKDAHDRITAKQWPRVCVRCRRTFNVGHSHFACFEPLAGAREQSEEKKRGGDAAAAAGAAGPGGAAAKDDDDKALQRPKKLRRVQIKDASVAAKRTS